MKDFPDNEYLEAVCKIGQGHDCCRYLLCGAKGFECGKGTPTANVIDARVAAGLFTARGDNCQGKFV